MKAELRVLEFCLDDADEEREIRELISHAADNMDTYQRRLDVSPATLTEKLLDEEEIFLKQLEGEILLLDDKMRMIIGRSLTNRSSDDAQKTRAP